MGDLALLAIGLIPGAVAMVTVGITLKKMKRDNARQQEQQKKESESRFLETENRNYLPVSKILIEVRRNSNFDYENWMAEVKRYEGNLIASEEIKRLYWENLEQVNLKYIAFDEAWDELVRQNNNRRITGAQYDSFKFQVAHLQRDVIDRCQVCYELMKTDAAEELKIRTTINPEVAVSPNDTPEQVEERYVPSEERALLNILESSQASYEMKAEAESLLKEWRTLHGESSVESPETESMKDDLATIKRIIEMQTIGVSD